MLCLFCVWVDVFVLHFSSQVPSHRYTPLKTKWSEIYKPIVEHMKVQIRFNPRKRCVELQSGSHTDLAGAMQKSADFVRAFMLGFEIRVNCFFEILSVMS